MRVKIMRRLYTPLLAPLFTLLLAGCATSGPLPAKDNYVAAEMTPLPPKSLVVILPTVEPEHAFSKGESMALEQIRAQLLAAGYRAAILDKANYTLLLKQESEAVGGIYDPTTGALRAAPYAQAMSNLAQRVCQEAHCALLLRYRLVIRQAELGGQTADWDGQRRRVKTSLTDGADSNFSGKTEAISVELLAMMADGSFAFKTYGGASLPYQAKVGAGKMALRSDLFQNDSEIAEAVRLAIAPITKH